MRIVLYQRAPRNYGNGLFCWLALAQTLSVHRFPTSFPCTYKQTDRFSQNFKRVPTFDLLKKQIYFYDPEQSSR